MTFIRDAVGLMLGGATAWYLVSWGSRLLLSAPQYDEKYSFDEQGFSSIPDAEGYRVV